MADMMRKVIPSPKKITRSDSQRAGEKLKA